MATRAKAPGPASALDELIGDSPGIVDVRQKIERLFSRPPGARGMPPVLIRGETGTGKGLTARAIHQAGPRAAGPFVDVNCAAIPETLIEAEMFGFERGAFTDAKQAKRGLFQAADRGTLFLDEVGLLPPPLQAKLLKVIEERVVRRLGSTQSESVDVWIMAATNTDLDAATRERRFREDLYHRLAVLTLSLPPLRERGRDILLLAERFLTRACADYDLVPKTLASEARGALLAYPWPGNIRELANVMERVALLVEAPVVTREMLGLPGTSVRTPPVAPPEPEESAPLAEAVGSVERQHLLDALRETDWNVTRAAERLGITRNTLRYRIEKYGLRPGAPGPAGRGPSAAHEPAPPAEPVAAPREESGPATVRWERRRLTVLRAVLAERPAVDAALDPGRALEVFVDKVRSFGGRVEALSPTGVVAVFGLDPVEDAPRRAANAAMAIQRAAERPWGGGDDRLGARIGIHVSHFMIGRLSGGAEIDEDAKREAWRVVDALAGGAPSGAILVSQAAAPFLERRFALVATAPAEPVPGEVYRLVRQERGAFELARRTARFVGRRRELEVLRSLLGSALEGQGQAVGIVGEAGIGKSRLLFEFQRSVAGETVTYIEAHCFEYGKAIPCLPVLDVIRHLCGILETDGPAALAEKLRLALHELGMDPEEGAPYLLHLLGVREGAERLGSLSPEALKARTFDTLRRLCLHASGRRPLVLAIEDLHWMDATSEDLVVSLVESLARAPVLLVATYRPGHRPVWMEKSYATQVALGPLSFQDSVTVMQSVLRLEQVPEPLAQVLFGTAQGNPFFLEELARAVQEQPGALQPSAVPGRIPDSIEEVLLARIDRLPPLEKGVLQCAAVIGKSVPLPLVQAIADLPGDTLREAVLYLQRAEFLHETSLDPEVTYTFRHALTHEVAYGSLLEEQRRALHARLVEVMERLYPDRLTEQSERLATHAFRGAAWDKAVAYLRQAGARAFARSANRQAVECLEQALRALAHLPESHDTLEQGIDLRFSLRDSLWRLGELAQLFEVLREAEALATALGDSRRQGLVAAYMCHYFWVVADHEQAVDAGERARAIAARLDDLGLEVETSFYLGIVHLAMGGYRRAVDILRSTVRSLEAGSPQIPRSFRRNGPPLCRAYLARGLAELGEFDEAIARGREALRITEAARNPFTTIASHFGLGSVYLRKGDFDEAIVALERGLALSKDYDLENWAPALAASLGLAYACSGGLEKGVALLERSAERAAAMKIVASGSLWLTYLGEAYLLAGRCGDARQAAVRALDLSRHHREAGYHAWTLRLLGDVAAREESPDVATAERAFGEAIAQAEALGMRPLVARSHRGLGLLYGRVSDTTKADAHLGMASALFYELAMPYWLERSET